MHNMFIGNRLTYARNRKAVSMQDVADLLGVGRQYIHKIETGKENKALSDKQLSDVSDYLGVLPSYFFKAQNLTICNNRIHYRSSSVPEYVRERAKIYAEDFLSVCDFTKKYIAPFGLGFPVFELDEKVNSSKISPENYKVEIEVAALMVRRELGLGQGPISNMVRVLENCGVIISASSEVSAKVDAFCNDDVLPIVIRNESKSPVRCRFDLAHELGHLILHKGIDNDPSENTLLEKQADYFASCLLLPKSSFITEFPSIIGDRLPWDKLFELKMRWKVSVAAIISRAYHLNLISQEIYKKAFIQLSNKGWRSGEPGDVVGHPYYIELEKPELIKNAISMIKNTYKDFLPAMRDELGMSAEMIKGIVGMPDLRSEEFERRKVNLTLV